MVLDSAATIGSADRLLICPTLIPVRVYSSRWSPSTCNLAVTFAGVWPDIPPGEA